MRIAISFESHNGTTDAFVLGATAIRATGSNRHDAEMALVKKVKEIVLQGELTFLDLELIHDVTGESYFVHSEYKKPDYWLRN